MTDLKLDALLDPVREIAQRASQEILKVYATDFNVAQKQDRSPLTEADLAAHETICEGLEKLTPNVSILSEESSSKVPYSTRSKWQSYWLVDPLDGTKEFIKKNGEFTVNIALIDAHGPVLGVVHVPVTNTCYFAARGRGAFKQEGDASPQKLSTRKANPQKLVVSGSRSHGGEALQSFVESLPGEVELISKGSSLKLCLVAEGNADIYPRFGPTSEWDTGAAQAVVEQAGGSVVTLSFERLSYNAKEDILNPYFLVIGDTEFDWGSRLPAGLTGK